METLYVIEFKNILTNDKWQEYQRFTSLEKARAMMNERWSTPHRLVKITETVLEEKGASD